MPVVRCVVRVDPEIRVDLEFARLSIAARCVWFESLFYLATIGEPAGFYPHTELVREAGRQADDVAVQLLELGCWSLCAFGYYVNSRSGCRVLPEERAAIPNAVRQMVYRRDGYQCVTCGSGEYLTLDHIHPWSLGGSDDPSNLQTMCRSCNSRKGARV
jgi:hypothetical protein